MTAYFLQRNSMDLKDFFRDNSKAAIAFSGGVDSAYLVYAAISCNADITAYYVKTQFQPAFEFDDARRFAEELGVIFKVIEFDALADEKVRSNTALRCYFCKKRIFTAICEAAARDGYTLILDGTNASDDANDRPGMRALKELSVRSPLRECNLTKNEVRRLSKEANLFTWDKPAYACLATRIPTDDELTEYKLLRTEKAEDYLASIGFRDFRVRTLGDSAKIQIKDEQFSLILQKKNDIVSELKKMYKNVLIDAEGR